MQNTKPTHGKKNIDNFVSDMVRLYSKFIILPNILTDIPDGQLSGGKKLRSSNSLL